LISTVYIWATEAGCNGYQLSALSWLLLPYSFKILWSHFLETRSLRIFGIDSFKSLLLLCATGILLGFQTLSFCTPLSLPFFICTLAISFFASIQDVALETYRIEHTQPEHSGWAVYFSLLGFRLGTLGATTGMIVLSHYYGWAQALRWASFLIAADYIFVFKGSKKVTSLERTQSGWFLTTVRHAMQGLGSWKTLRRIFLNLFVFKMADIFIITISSMFLRSQGYSMIQIAYAEKATTLVCFIMGAGLASLSVRRWSIFKNLSIWIEMQIVVSILWLVQSTIVVDPSNITRILIITGIHQLISGMGNLYFWNYISSLCHAPNIPVQFGLMCSFSTFSRIIISSFSALIYQYFYGPTFFIISIIFCLPGLALYLSQIKKCKIIAQ
jgi:PAT family beta-lactamase induction signal transducer AmpG